MNWDRPILTDSGGFQVFSLGAMRKIREEGVEFRSHIDGSKHMLSPERSIEIQNALGADIIMAFDECTPYPADRSYVKDSLERTTRWLRRCKEYHKDTESASLCLGSCREACMQTCGRKALSRSWRWIFRDMPSGGLSVGEPKELMYEIMDDCVELLPADKPRYLMGVGSPDCLFEGSRGLDMFDCVLPTGSHATAWQ